MAMTGLVGLFSHLIAASPSTRERIRRVRAATASLELQKFADWRCRPTTFPFSIEAEESRFPPRGLSPWYRTEPVWSVISPGRLPLKPQPVAEDCADDRGLRAESFGGILNCAPRVPLRGLALSSRSVSSGRPPAAVMTAAGIATVQCAIKMRGRFDHQPHAHREPGRIRLNRTTAWPGRVRTPPERILRT